MPLLLSLCLLPTTLKSFQRADTRARQGQRRRSAVRANSCACFKLLLTSSFTAHKRYESEAPSISRMSGNRDPRATSTPQSDESLRNEEGTTPRDALASISAQECLIKTAQKTFSLFSHLRAAVSARVGTLLPDLLLLNLLLSLRHHSCPISPLDSWSAFSSLSFTQPRSKTTNPTMRLSIFLSTASILPILVSATPFDFLDHTTQQYPQHPFGVSTRIDRIPRPSRVQRPSESVLVHLVDPASPTTSTVVTPSSIAREALEYSEKDGEEEEDEDDSPNFGSKCEYSQGNPFSVCGDYFDQETETDHGLFCSPRGICAGKGAVCGSNKACSQGESLPPFSSSSDLVLRE